MQVSIIIFAFVMIFGAIIGSFLNVVIYRLPQGKSIARPRSHCPGCGHVLQPLELIPVLSYVGLKGRCGVCKSPISWRYPAIELFTGIAFCLVYWRYGLTVQSGIYMVFTALLIALAAIDIDCHRLPNALTALVAALAAVQWLTGVMGINPEALSLIGMLWGAAIGGLPVLVIIVIGGLLGAEAMGLGDFKLMLASGLLLGPILAFYSLLIAFVLGGIGALVALTVFKIGRKGQIAFGPYLAIGLYLACILNTWLYLH